MTRAALLAFAFAVCALLSTRGARAQGFRGEYYRGYAAYPALPTEVVARRIDVVLSAAGARASLPAPLTGAMFYTVRWTGSFTADASGTYQFELASEDDGVLIVDGVVEIDLRGIHPLASALRLVTLGPGRHWIEVIHSVGTSGYGFALGWAPPAEAVVRLPLASEIDPSPPFDASARRVAFDSGATDRFVTDEFLASDGVRFVADTPAPDGTWLARPRVVALAPELLASAPHALRNSSRGIEAGMTLSAGAPLTLTFARPQRRVAAAVGSGLSTMMALGPAEAALRAFDVRGSLVAADHVDRRALESRRVDARMEVFRGAADIATVTVDFGASNVDEHIDDLVFEAPATAPPPLPDAEAPVLEVLEPAGDTVYAAFGNVPLRVRVREPSGVLTAVSATARPSSGPVAMVSLSLAGLTDPACAAPACREYVGAITLPNGHATIRFSATDGSRNTGTADVRVNVTSATVVHVTEDAGRAVAGAELFVDGRRHPTPTDGTGRIAIVPPVRAGAALIARAMAHEAPALRGAHAAGGTRDWAYRVYLTSALVGLDGALATHTVSDPAAVQRLRLDPRNVLVGLHLVASLEWDATPAELAAVRSRIEQTAGHLYTVTDGQMLIERAEIVDDGALWDDADYRVHVRWLRANVSCHRNALHVASPFCRPWMNMTLSDNVFVYAHEFGHYGMDLGDEYVDRPGGGAILLCTAAAYAAGATGPLARRGPQAACLMAANEGKLCSAHPANPHVRGTRQGETNCWDHVAHVFRDARPATPRWRLQTPVTRGGLVAAIPRVPDAFRPVISVDNRARSVLCAPFQLTVWRDPVVRRPGEPPLGHQEVWLDVRDGRTIHLGRTNADGSITVRGAHVDDTLRLGWFDGRPVPRSACVPAM